MLDTKPIVQLKAAMLQSQTLDELHALIINYTHEEMLQAYKELSPEQQAKIETIYQRDSQSLVISH